MRTANWHTFQVLTKRADVLSKLLRKPLQPQAALSHIWWGVSVEDRKYGLLRIDHLRATPANVRFLSIEPLLEDLGTINLTGIHWVIVGGETGPAARSMEAAWVESLRDQCNEANVPFFFKQWSGVQSWEVARRTNIRRTTPSCTSKQSSHRRNDTT